VVGIEGIACGTIPRGRVSQVSRGCRRGDTKRWAVVQGGVDFSVGGIYISPSPKRGRGVGVGAGRSWKEIPLTLKHPARRCFSHNINYIALSVLFMDTCPKTVVPFQDTRSPAWCGKANECTCSAVGTRLASKKARSILTLTATHYDSIYLNSN
jgi:hypothetical protein